MNELVQGIAGNKPGMADKKRATDWGKEAASEKKGGVLLGIHRTGSNARHQVTVTVVMFKY